MALGHVIIRVSHRIEKLRTGVPVKLGYHEHEGHAFLPLRLATIVIALCWTVVHRVASAGVRILIIITTMSVTIAIRATSTSVSFIDIVVSMNTNSSGSNSSITRTISLWYVTKTKPQDGNSAASLGDSLHGRDGR